jgi:hypothetical protein
VNTYKKKYLTLSTTINSIFHSNSKLTVAISARWLLWCSSRGDLTTGCWWSSYSSSERRFWRISMSTIWVIIRWRSWKLMRKFRFRLLGLLLRNLRFVLVRSLHNLSIWRLFMGMKSYRISIQKLVLFILNFYWSMKYFKSLDILILFNLR